MRVAFLFLTIKNPHKLWKRFFYKISKDYYSIYIHPKNKNLDTYWEPYIIKDSINTSWANISLVKATLALIEAAKKDPKNKKFVLLSETCIPIWNYKYIYSKLHNDYTYIFHFWANDNTSQNRYRQLVGIHPILHDRFLKQSQWFILDRNVLSLIDNSMISNFSKMFAPDEHYFINILYQKDNRLKKIIKNIKTTYVNLEKRKSTAHPNTYTTLTKNNILDARNSGAFFMRKVSHNCLIDKEIEDMIFI